MFVNKINADSLLKPNVPSAGASGFRNLLDHLLVLMTGDIFLQLSSLDFTRKRQVNMLCILCIQVFQQALRMLVFIVSFFFILLNDRLQKE